MAPKIPNRGCPHGTFKGKDTCFCEDHCSWEICRLMDPPNNCIIEGKLFWKWDENRDAWVATGNRE